MFQRAKPRIGRSWGNCVVVVEGVFWGLLVMMLLFIWVFDGHREEDEVEAGCVLLLLLLLLL